MAKLTKTYRLVWDGATKAIRVCGAFQDGTVTETNLESYEADTEEEIQAMIEQENLTIPPDLENYLQPCIN